MSSCGLSHGGRVIAALSIAGTVPRVSLSPGKTTAVSPWPPLRPSPQRCLRQIRPPHNSSTTEKAAVCPALSHGSFHSGGNFTAASPRHVVVASSVVMAPKFYPNLVRDPIASRGQTNGGRPRQSCGLVQGGGYGRRGSRWGLRAKPGRR